MGDCHKNGTFPIKICPTENFLSRPRSQAFRNVSDVREQNRLYTATTLVTAEILVKKTRLSRSTEERKKRIAKESNSYSYPKTLINERKFICLE